MILLKLLDFGLPIVTRDGRIPVFCCDDKHVSRPYSFLIDGKVRSYYRTGRYDPERETSLDLINLEGRK